jgi:hypothetical protein
VPDLLTLRGACRNEQLPRDTILKHLPAADAVVAKSKEDPSDVGLDVSIVLCVEAREDFHQVVVNRELDRLLVQCKVHERQGAVNLD